MMVRYSSHGGTSTRMATRTRPPPAASRHVGGTDIMLHTINSSRNTTIGWLLVRVRVPHCSLHCNVRHEDFQPRASYALLRSNDAKPTSEVQMIHRFLHCKTSSVVQLTKLVHCKLGGCDWDGLHMQCSAISGAVRRMASRPLLNVLALV